MASRPGFVRLAWGSWRASAVAADSGPSFFIPDFFLTNSRPWAIPSQWRELPVSDFLGELSRWEEPVPELFWERPDLDEFRRSFEDLQRRFAAGQLKKAVPVVFECASLPFSPGMRATVLRNLLQRSGGRTRVYGFWNDEGGILGASPEDLFTLSTGNALRTMALAGTYRKKEGFDFSSILRDPKERREHQLVIDDLREALVPFGEVRVGETEVLELPSLVHLKTELEARLNEAVPF
ncbi:MAG: chorismate-binding protein, partial [Oligoflexia bacterium]|nr:chorismate-binding protein [Oligoflexia bacterium]